MPALRAREARRSGLTVFGLYHARQNLEALDGGGPTVGVDRRWAALQVVVVGVLVIVVVLATTAIVMVSLISPGVGVRVGLGCLVAGILTLVVGVRLALSYEEVIEGYVASLVTIGISFWLVATGVGVLFGGLVGYRRARQDAHGRGDLRPEERSRSGLGSLPDGTSP